LDVSGIIALVTAVIAILSALVAFLRTLANREKMERNQTEMFGYVDRQTNGLWQTAENNLEARFTAMEQRLRREMHERIGRELGDIRKAMKSPKQEE